MQNISIEQEVGKIIKEGFLEKESRFFKTWRKRWFVLTPQTLMSFKQQKSYTNPTEVIVLSEIVSIKSVDDETHREHSFRVDTPADTFNLQASSNSQKEQWIGQIGKAMVKAGKIQED